MKLNQITLDVADTERSVAFYTRIGLVLIVSSVPRYARLECPDGSATLSLHAAAGTDRHEGTPPAKLYFEVPDVRARYEELTRLGILFDTEPEAQTWLWTEAWFRDPDGNRLCLYHAGENRRFPPWRVPAADDGVEGR